jgi:RNA polymerase sigma factor (sigma-70 family)
MNSDDRLARRAAGGEQRAFEEIYSRHHQALYRFCLAMVGNSQDAQDALQNTMVKALHALPGERRRIRLRPWLYRIARNESVEILRKRRDSVELEDEVATAPGVTETAEARERLRTLLSDLGHLPERQRAALVMRELAGLGFDQIAAALGTSAAVARQTLYEARLSLRQLEAGREMRCADVMRELSDGDGRVTRRRDIRAHLRSCAECRAFRDEIAKRHEDLAALAPLPLAVSAGLLKGVLSSSTGGTMASASSLGAGAGAGGGGFGGAIGAGAGKAITTSALVKSAATVATVAVVGVSAADRTGVIDLPLSGRGNDAPARVAPEAAAGTGGGEAEAPAILPGDSTLQRSEAAGSDRNENGGPGEESATRAAGRRAARNASSHSQAGQNSPGGGYGRSGAQRKGRPEDLPAASAKGQATAAAKKPSQATSPPSKFDTGDHGGSSTKGSPPAPKPLPPPAAAPPAPPEAPGPSPKGDAGGAQQGATPPGHEG